MPKECCAGSSKGSREVCDVQIRKGLEYEMEKIEEPQENTNRVEAV